MQKVSAFLNALKEGEQERDDKIVAELGKIDNRGRSPLEVAILQVSDLHEMACH